MDVSLEVIVDKVETYFNCEVIDVVRVEKGNSTSLNYKVTTDKDIFFIKIYLFNSDLKYRFLKYVSEYNTNVQKPLLDFEVEKGCRCLVTKWIDGTTLHLTRDNSKNVASILKKIHSIPIPTYKFEYINLYDEINYYITFITDNSLNFFHKDDIISYLINNMAIINSRKVFTFVHNDVHINNFINCDDNIILIDYESINISDPWRDLVYAVFFHDKSENEFWFNVLQEYFNGLIPSSFWSIIQYYCYVQLLRIIICEYQKYPIYYTETTYHVINDIVCNYSLTSIYPKWINDIDFIRILSILDVTKNDDTINIIDEYCRKSVWVTPHQYNVLCNMATLNNWSIEKTINFIMENEAQVIEKWKERIKLCNNEDDYLGENVLS